MPIMLEEFVQAIVNHAQRAEVAEAKLAQAQERIAELESAQVSPPAALPRVEHDGGTFGNGAVMPDAEIRDVLQRRSRK